MKPEHHKLASLYLTGNKVYLANPDPYLMTHTGARGLVRSPRTDHVFMSWEDESIREPVVWRWELCPL